MDDRVIVSETRLEEGNGNVAFDNVFFLRSTPFSFSPERQKHLEKKLDVRYPLSLPRKMQVLRFPAIYIPYRILICTPPPPPPSMRDKDRHSRPYSAARCSMSEEARSPMQIPIPPSSPSVCVLVARDRRVSRWPYFWAAAKPFGGSINKCNRSKGHGRARAECLGGPGKSVQSSSQGHGSRWQTTRERATDTSRDEGGLRTAFCQGMYYGVWCTVYNAWCIMYHVWCIMYHVWCIMYHVWCIMYHV